MAEHASEPRGATMLTAVVDDAGAYGRVVRAADGRVARVVEARDAAPEELAIGEYNAGLYVFDRAALADVLARLDASNAQGEVYLTDAVERIDGAGGGAGRRRPRGRGRGQRPRRSRRVRGGAPDAACARS